MDCLAKPIRDSKGRYISGYTQWSSESVVKSPGRNWTDQDSRASFVRFENIDENPLPEDLKISWLPVNMEGLEVAHKMYSQISVCQEPAIVMLPDKRLFTVMRTMTGYIWYSVSDDDGETWRTPEVLRYKDDGEKIRNPLVSCPIYALSDNKFILIHYDNDGRRGEYDQFKKCGIMGISRTFCEILLVFVWGNLCRVLINLFGSVLLWSFCRQMIFLLVQKEQRK